MLEIRPILSALWRNKIAALLIVIQLALTLAIVGNASIIISDRNDMINRPTGMAVEDIITVSFNPVNPDIDLPTLIRTDLDMLRAMPGVLQATHSSHLPLSGSGSASAFYLEPNKEIDDEVANIYYTSPEFLQTLGLNLIAGRNFTESEMATFGPSDDYDPTVTIVTQKFADKLFPEGDALGKFIYTGGDDPKEIIGIVERHLGAWATWSLAGQVAFYPALFDFNMGRFLVRAESGKRDEVIKAIEVKLAEKDPNRVINIKTLSDLLDKGYAKDTLMVNVLTVVIFLLTFIIALGIVGLTFFWINQRRKQIGVRRALGATRGAISRYFLVENFMIAGAGIAIGMAIAQISNHFMVANFSQPVLPVSTMLLCALVLLGVSLAAALVPALRAANISPAMATRSV